MAQGNPFDQFDNAPAAGPQVLLPVSPTVQAKDAAELARIQQQIGISAAASRREAAKAQRDALEWQATHNPDGSPKLNITQRPTLTAKERADAIAQYNSALDLNRVISNLENLYQQGPGATKGVAGIQDFLPTPANQRFDSASNQARGTVKSALGMTGGENNTATEARMNIGGYLPQASDYDQTILDKIQALRDMRDKSANTAIAILGGRPDANGNVTPVQPQGTPAAPGVQPIYANPQAQAVIATGGMAQVPDPARSALVDAMVRSGKSADQINAALAAAGMEGGIDAGQVAKTQAWLQTPAGKAYKGSIAGEAFKNVPTGAMSDALASPIATGVASAFDAVAPFGIYGNSARDALQAAKDRNPGAALAGTMLGGVGGAMAGEGLVARGLSRFAPAAARFAPVIGDGLYGAIQGGGNADDGSGLSGAAKGTVAGIGGGIAGRATMRGVANIFRGARDPAVDYLRSRGVPTTVGQTLGGWAKGLEDRLAGIPVVGDMVNSRRREGLQAFNQEAFNQALAPLGANTGGNIQEAGVDAARAAVRRGYRNALDGVQVAPDAQFATDYGQAVANGSAITRTGPEFQTFIDRRIAPFVQQPAMTGAQIQDVLQSTRRADFGNDAMGSFANAAAGDVGSAVEGLLTRQAPQAMPAYNAAQHAYRGTGIVRDAVDAARNGSGSTIEGVFTPAQLATAASRNARRFGGAQGTTNQPFFELSRAGQAVLPSKVPDSGTAGRLAMLALPAALGGGGAGVDYATGGDSGKTVGLALGAALTAGGSRTAQRALTSLLADRPDLAIRIGNQINRRARIGGIFGAPLLVSATD